MPLSTERSTVHALEHLREFTGTCTLPASTGAATSVVVTGLAVGDVILAIYPASAADIHATKYISAHTAYVATVDTAAFTVTSSAGAAQPLTNIKVLTIAKGF